MKLNLLIHQMILRSEVLHRNMLFPIQSIEIAENADKSNSVIQKQLVLQKANELMETYFND